MTMTLEGVYGVPSRERLLCAPLRRVRNVYDTAGAGNFWLDLSLATMGRTSASAGRGAIITTPLGGPQASGWPPRFPSLPSCGHLQKAGYSPTWLQA